MQAHEMYESMIQSLLKDVANERQFVGFLTTVANHQCNRAEAWKAVAMQTNQRWEQAIETTFSTPINVAECIYDEALEIGWVDEEKPAETKGGAT